MRGYVLITGATGGLGKAFAAECAWRGWNLFLTDLSEQRLAALATGMQRQYGITVQHQACDLTDNAARAALWQYFTQKGVRFHSLINVAGLDYEGWFSERRVDELQTILRLNIEATVEMTRRVLQYREPSEKLRIVTVSSLAAFYPMPVKAVYAASKRFLLDWSLALQQELRGSGVTITVLCPAGMRTTPECIRAIDAQGCMGRMTTLDVGNIAAHTINHALAGHRIYIPGVINQMLRTLGGFIPSAIVTRYIGMRWEKSQRRQRALTLTAPAVGESASVLTLKQG